MLLPQIIGGLLQERPEVPKFEKVSLAESQREATNANIANYGQIKDLASQVNQFNQDELLKHLRQVIPGYDALISKTKGLIDSQLNGEIPKDVSDAISRNSAVRALEGGYGGTGMQRNLVARDLGLTSLALTEKGMASAERWIESARKNLSSSAFDVTSMFITPGQQWAAHVRDSEGQFNRDWVENQLKAEYSLGTVVGKAMIKTDDQITQMVSSVAGSVAGAAVCWVAREVFGIDNPKWVLFRTWLLTKAPESFLNWYLSNGEAFAAWLKSQPVVKQELREWMEVKITELQT